VGKDGDVIRRRRECLSCGRRFTTYERIEEELPLVVKRDGRREPYDRQKILSGIRKACEKRPVSYDTIEHLVEALEQEFQSGAEKEISSIRIGERVMAKLLQVDDVAYVRFASVYRQFKDVSQFVEEIKTLISEPPAERRSHDAPSGVSRHGVHAAGAAPGPQRGRTDRAQPAVGAVVVRGGRVVGEGYHHAAGLPHAEIEALGRAGNAARGADLYVTLEPCDHRGRTGPCTGAILAAGVARVAYAMEDPNPAVSGRGARRLRQAGLVVHRGLMEAEAASSTAGSGAGSSRGSRSSR